MNKKFWFALTAFVLSVVGLFFILFSTNSVLYFFENERYYAILKRYIELDYPIHTVLGTRISGLSLTAMISFVFVIMFTLDKKEIEYKEAIIRLLKKKWLVVLVSLYLVVILVIVTISFSIDQFTFQTNYALQDIWDVFVYRVMPISCCLVNLTCIISFYVYILKFRNNKLKEIV